MPRGKPTRHSTPRSILHTTKHTLRYKTICRFALRHARTAVKLVRHAFSRKGCRKTGRVFLRGGPGAQRPGMTCCGANEEPGARPENQPNRQGFPTRGAGGAAPRSDPLAGRAMCLEARPEKEPNRQGFPARGAGGAAPRKDQLSRGPGAQRPGASHGCRAPGAQRKAQHPLAAARRTTAPAPTSPRRTRVCACCRPRGR